MRADRIALAVALAVALAPTARAGSAEDPAAGGAAPAAAVQAPAARAGLPPILAAVPLLGDGGDAGPRAALGHQLADETASIDRALAAVGDKLSAAELTRSRRLAAALRSVRAAPGDDAAAVARRRAAAHLLLARDRGERALLVDEVAQLRGAHTRVAGELARLPGLALPGELTRPARGKIARHYGTLEHERTRATLSRRGIDIEVDDHSPVIAPAAGTVRYAGPIRGLDHGVIIDCGEYLTVIAKLGEVALPVGAPIAAGDRLGRAARHRVYLEVRVKLGPGGLPIDPEPLLAGAAPAPPAATPGAARSRSPRHALD